MSEKKLLNQLLLRATAKGYRLFRNNVGKGWVGKRIEFIKETTTKTVYPGDVVIRGARPLNAGLHVGSSDLIGWKTKKVTYDMLGKDVAIFTSIEAKTKSLQTTAEQSRWIQNIIEAGGIALVARDEDDIK